METEMATNSTSTPPGSPWTVDTLITCVAFLVMALSPIYYGSLLSLSKRLSGEEEEEEMTAKDAYTFPFVAGAFLFGLYIAFKVVGKELVNYILTAYFLFIGFVSLYKTLCPLTVPYFPQPSRQVVTSFTVPSIPFVIDAPIHLSLSTANLVVATVCLYVIHLYLNSKHWILNNILGLCFSYQGVALLGLQIKSYKVACILMVGLFFYDIFWVFGTDVMVTVAKSFDAPVKLLFPKSLFASEYAFSMLGLGDIVLPGAFISFLYRYDHHRAANKTKSTPYFTVNFALYFVGLALTFFVMHYFQAAQPALLYLVPACVGSSLFTSILLGDFQGLISFVEEVKEVKEETQKNK